MKWYFFGNMTTQFNEVDDSIKNMLVFKLRSLWEENYAKNFS